MREIQVDDEVYRVLEAQVQGFGDTPNSVLRRILGITPMTEGPREQRVLKPADTGTHRTRGKAPKANLRDLIRVGSLSEGQILFMHDYQGNRLDGIQAKVCGSDLEFDGQRISMSALTKQLMQNQGYKSSSYRGPQFWYTAEGKSVKQLWDEYLLSDSGQGS